MTNQEEYELWEKILVCSMMSLDCESEPVKEFFDLFATYVKTGKINKYQDKFAKTTVPSVAAALLCSDPVTVQEKMLVQKTILKIAFLLTEALTNDIFDFDIILVHLFNKKSAFYKPKPKNSKPYYLTNVIQNYITSDSFNSLITRINDSEKLPNIQHFNIFFLILEKSQICYDETLVSSFVSKIATALDRFYNSIDSTNLRKIDNETLLLIMLESVQLSTFDPCFSDVCISAMNFSLKLLKCDFLDKQVIGARCLAENMKELNILNNESFVEWAKSSEFITILTEHDLHETVLQRLTDAVVSYIGIGLIKCKEMLKIWEKTRIAHSSKKKSIYDMLVVCLQLQTDDVVAEFFDVLEKEPVSANIIDFMGKVAINLSIAVPAISNRSAAYLLSKIDDENYKTNAFNAIKLITGYQVTSELIMFLFTSLSEKLKTSPSLLIIQLLEALLDWSLPSFDISLVNTLTTKIKECQELRRDLFNLLLDLLEKSKKKLTSEQVKAMFTVEDDVLYEFFTKLFDVCTNGPLYKAALDFLETKLNEYNYKEATESFARFACGYELAVERLNNNIIEANINSSPSKKLPRWAPKALNARFKYTLKLIAESPDAAANVATEFIEQFITQGRTLFNIESFKFLVKTMNDTLFNGSEVAKVRCVSILQYIVPKFESEYNCEDFGVKKHQPNHEGQIKITVINLDKRIVLEVLPTTAIHALHAKLAVRCSLPIDSITLFYEQTQLSRYYSLAQYGIENDAELTMQVVRRRKVQYTKQNLPSIILLNSGYVNHFFGFLSSDCKELVEITYKLLCDLPTAPAALEIAKSDDVINDIVSSKNWQRQSYILVAINELFDVKEDEDEYEEEYEEEEEKEEFEKDGELLETLIKGKIHIEAVVPCIKIFFNYQTPLIKRYVKEFFEIALKALELPKVNPVDVSYAFFLMVDLAPKKLSDVMFSPDSCLSSKIMNFGIEEFVMLNNTIIKLDNKRPAFAFLSKFLKELPQHEEIANLFMRCLASSISKDSNVKELVNTCIEFLQTAKGSLFDGICFFLSTVCDIFPKQVPPSVAELLAQRIVLEQDQHVQSNISHIIHSIIKVSPSVEGKVAAVLLDPLKEPIKIYQYEPHKYELEVTSMAGLKNQGATCYLNSVLQQFYSSKKFRLDVLALRDDKQWIKELQLIYAGMQLSNQTYQDTKEFCKAFKVSPVEQMDAVEFLQSLLDKLPASVSEPYTGTIVNTIEGMHEVFSVSNTENFFTMTLDVKGFSCFEDSFESFLQEEKFVGDNQYLAESLGKKIDAKRFARIGKCPEHLIIQLKRFEYDLDTYQRYKVNDLFEFPFEFDVAPYTVSKESFMYKLTGIIIHDGNAEFGHYYSLIKIAGKWTMFNDKHVMPFQEESIESFAFGGIDESEDFNSSAYILFYTKSEEPTKYSADIEDAKKVIQPEISQEIEVSNNLFDKYESIFTEQFADFILSFKNKELLITYYINVFTHSTLETIWPDITKKLLPYTADVLKTLLNEDVLKSALIFSNEAPVRSLCELCEKAVSLLSEEENNKMFIAFAYGLYYSTSEAFSVQLYSHMIHVILKKIPAKEEHMDFIIKDILKCASEQQNTYMNIAELLLTVAENCELLNEDRIDYLIAIAPTILSPAVNATPYISIFVRGNELGICEKNLVFRELLRTLDVTKKILIFITLLHFETANYVLRLFLTESVDMRVIVKAITLMPIRSKVISQAETLIFPFIVVKNDAIRATMEKYCASFLPVKKLPKKAESIFNDEDNYKYLDSDDLDEEEDKETLNDDVDLNVFSSLLIKYFTEYDVSSACSEPNFVLTSLARVIQRLAVIQPSAELCKLTLKLLFAVCEQHFRNDGNELELCRAAACFDLQTIEESLEEDIDSIMELLFPVSFEDYEFGTQLFISAFKIIQSVASKDEETFTVLMMLPDFTGSVVNFLNFASPSEASDFISFISNEERAAPLYEYINENEAVDANMKRNLLTIINKSTVEVPKHCLAEAIRGALNDLSDSFRDYKSIKDSCALLDIITKFAPMNEEEIEAKKVASALQYIIPFTTDDLIQLQPHLVAMIKSFETQKTTEYVNKLFSATKKSCYSLPLLAIFVPFLVEENVVVAIETASTIVKFMSHSGIELFLKELKPALSRITKECGQKSAIATLVDVCKDACYNSPTIEELEKC